MVVRPFISYAREDRAVALQLYRDLSKVGAEPWIDVEDLLGGQEWKRAITDAISESSHFLALISAKSVSKHGFVQKELRQALDLLDTFPPGDVFVIPVRLDESQPRHERLTELQWVDMFPEYQDGLRKLLRSLRMEVVTAEMAEYSSHGPAHREASRLPSAVVEKDEDGFLTSTSVAELVLGRIQGRQRLRTPPILLFENSYQQTWLVITERVIACVLDDIEKPASYDPLRWHCRHRFALPVETEAYKATAGLIHLGPEHRDWLYSPRLHPDAGRLRAEIEGMLST
jgi:hypothetical protein